MQNRHAFPKEKDQFSFDEKSENLSHESTIGIYLPLIGLITRLRNTSHIDSLEKCRQEIQALLQNTLSKVTGRDARSTAASMKQHNNISYLLCCYIDEAILSTDWGVSGRWINNSFLSIYHENIGGEIFYQHLKECLESPGNHRNELQLFYLLLSSGYMGKMRILTDGDIHIDQLRQKIYRAGIEPYLNHSFQTHLFKKSEKKEIQNVSDYFNWVAFGAPVGVLFLIYVIFSMITSSSISETIEVMTKAMGV